MRFKPSYPTPFLAGVIMRPESPPKQLIGLDNVFWWLAYAAIAAIILVLVAAQISPSSAMQIVSNFVTFFASVFLSFVVTRHYAQVTAREELKRLAEAAGSRIFLLSVQMRQVASDLTDVEVDDKASETLIRSISTQIDRLSAQSDLSVEDLERIADVDLSLPAMRDAAQVRVEAATKKEQIPCPHCDKSVELTMGTAPGASRHGKCDACRRGFVVHRISDGALKVAHTGYFQIDCPNPTCENKIGINRRDDEWGAIIRNCFQCYARVQYDLDKGMVESYAIEAPLDIGHQKIVAQGQVRRGPCPGCGYSIVFHGQPNKNGEQLTSCPRCTKLIRVVTAVEGSG